MIIIRNWAPSKWMEDPICYTVAIRAVFDALQAAGPTELKFAEKVPQEQRDLQNKMMRFFAGQRARGADIRFSKKGEEK